MVKIVFLEHDGARREHEAPEGWTALDVAVQHEIASVMGRCCGGCVCATCHVYVESSHAALLPKPSREENETLNFTATERRPNSRLACQITLQPACDGIVLRVAERQL